MEVEEKLIFAEEEKAFEIEEGGEDVEHTFALPTEGSAVLASVDGNNPDAASKEKNNISSSAHGLSPGTYKKTREEMRAKFEEESPEQSVRVERVMEWRAQVNSALQEGEEVEEGSDLGIRKERE